MNRHAKKLCWSVSALVVATALATDALGAAAETDVARAKLAKSSSSEAALPAAPDMRLWSFGDCDNRFPFVDSAEHKECVRVVGSQEAKDARAYRFCATSYGSDPAEVARCKASYDARKAGIDPAAAVAGATAQAPEQVPPEIMRKVKAITTAAVEQDRGAAAERPAQAAQAQPQPGLPPLEGDEGSGFWTPAMVLGFGFAFMLLLGVGAMVARRKQSGSFQRS